jgi:transposase-like protein
MIQEAYVQGISTRAVDELVKAMGRPTLTLLKSVCSDSAVRLRFPASLATEAAIH